MNGTQLAELHRLATRQCKTPEAELMQAIALEELYRYLGNQMQLTDEQIEAANDRLINFVELGWNAMEPEPFARNWHHELICEYIEAMYLSQIQDLVINIQPRALKSLICSVFAPVWLWLKEPSAIFLCLSYATALANTLSIKRRNLIMSPFYQQVMVDRPFELVAGENRISEFTNTRKGQMFARGLDGSVTGVGGNWLVVDDPNDPEKMNSTPIRERNNMRGRAYITNRLNNPKRARRLIIQQRTHDVDFTGMVKEEFGDKFEYLILPAIAEERMRIWFPISGVEKKRSPGRLLHEARFGPEQITEAQWDRRAFQCLYQQAPIPAGGGIVKIKDFQRYNTLPAFVDFWVASWDTAQEKNETSAFWCGILAAIKDSRIYIVDVHIDQHEYPDGERTLVSLAQKWELRTKPHLMLIEKKSTGAVLMQRLLTEPKLWQESIRPKPVTPCEDKITRMCAEVPLIEAGYVYLPETAPWLPDYERSLMKFPDGLMDPVDATSQLLSWFRTSGRKRNW